MIVDTSEWGATDWVLVVSAVTAPMLLVAIALIVRGYSIKVWRDHHKEEDQ